MLEWTWEVWESVTLLVRRSVGVCRVDYSLLSTQRKAFFERSKDYPGEIALCLIQFPTPYRLPKEGGNMQLPTSQFDGFMVTETLLESIHLNLLRSNGKLLLQSNCEDVAVFMRNLACDHVGFTFETEDSQSPVSCSFENPQPKRVPQRTLDWIAMGGERAIGPGWFQTPVFHKEGCTETEKACLLNHTPVHRCLLRV
mmetsp:Transcript_25606/g.45165  ORF Transcript_25606/g.45165 Transcript_25606/m.45165 type:complete len:198 (-) Transcript_25606:1041-1634(-)